MCREACETALKEKQFLDSPAEESLEETISNLEIYDTLERVFSKAGEADIPTEVSTSIPFLNKKSLFFL